jgi:hypothetical protein
MAVLKWSSLLSGAKGKLRGSVLQFSSGGQIIRANRRANQFSNPRWSAGKTNIATNANTWRSLTPSEITGWAAATSLYPTKDRFGNTRYPAAYELFIRLNNGSLFQTGAQLFGAPSPVTFSNILPFTVTAIGGSDLYLNTTAAWASDELLIISCTAPLSVGRSVPKGKYVQISSTPGTGSLTYVDFYTAYVNQFGQLPTGMQVYVSIRLINVNNGQYSTPAIVQAIIS